MDIDKIIDTLIGNKDDKKVENFLRFLSDKLWNLYNDYLMDKIKMGWLLCHPMIVMLLLLHGLIFHQSSMRALFY